MKGLFARIILPLSVISLCGCNQRVNSGVGPGEQIYSPAYANGFSITAYGESTMLTVKNPWQGAENVEMNLFLSRGGEAPPEGFDGVVVDAPLKRVVCMSASYVAYIDAIGEIDAVKGVSGARYITNENVRERYEEGDVREVGYDANMNYELVAGLRPDLVMVYGIAGENSAITRKLNELGVDVIYIGDYVENSPLGRAEWIVAFGEMFDKREQAVKTFGKIASDYNETKRLVEDTLSAGSGGRPAVMLNAPYKDTWFVPGDRSYMVRLISDAGGRYACAGTDSDRSRPISSETAYVAAWKSDIWLNPGQIGNMRELLGLNPKFSDIPPVKNGRVFNCTKRGTADGGSDFWESGSVRPDIILRDMVGIFHPGLLPERELYYFMKLE